MNTANIIIDANGKVLLTRRSDYGTFPRLWNLPGGRFEPDENQYMCIEREVSEELGFDIKDKNLTIVDTIAEGDFQRFFFSLKITDELTPALSNEADMYAYVSPTELNNYEFAYPIQKKIIQKYYGLCL
jgi:mutator protein MutT